MRVTLQCALLLVLIAAWVAGCTTTKSSHCAAFEAIPPSNAQIDVMTEQERERALAELLKFERICGLRP